MSKTNLGGVDVGSSQTRRALILSLGDGMLCQVMMILVDTFAVAAALSLKAPAIAIAMLSSLPVLLGSFSQAFALGMINPKESRKRYIVASVRIQALVLVVAATAGWMPQGWAPWIFVLASALYGVSGSLFTSLWMTWFSDLVPDRVMGRHSAWRSMFFSLAQLVASILVGLFSRSYTMATAPWIFFCILFAVAGVLRLGSGMLLSAQYEPPRTKPFIPVSFKNFRPPRQLALYAVATGLFNGSAAMSGPFFSVWFLRDLHFNYLSLTIATCSTIVGSMLSLRMWGNCVDTMGPARVLRITVFMAAIVPLPFLFFNQVWGIWLFNLYSGIAWSGVAISGFKYLLRCNASSRPEQAITFVNCAQAVIVFLLSMLGGYIATRLPVTFGYQLRTLFLLSMIMRITVSLFLVARIREIGEDKTPLEKLVYKCLKRSFSP